MSNKTRIGRDADSIRRSSIPSIRDTAMDKTIKKESIAEGIGTDDVVVAAISGTSETALSKSWTTPPTSITIVNTHDTVTPTVSLWHVRSEEPDTQHILYKTLLPIGTGIVLYEEELFIDSLGTSMKIQLAGSGTPTVDVRIKF